MFSVNNEQQVANTKANKQIKYKKLVLNLMDFFLEAYIIYVN
jgi:hypothetical protein